MSMDERHKPLDERGHRVDEGSKYRQGMGTGAEQQESTGSGSAGYAAGQLPGQPDLQAALESSKLTDRNVPPAHNQLPVLFDSREAERSRSGIQRPGPSGATTGSSKPEHQPSRQEADPRAPLQGPGLETGGTPYDASTAHGGAHGGPPAPTRA
jgi:hypothetical protein